MAIMSRVVGNFSDPSGKVRTSHLRQQERGVRNPLEAQLYRVSFAIEGVRRGAEEGRPAKNTGVSQADAASSHAADGQR